MGYGSYYVKNLTSLIDLCFNLWLMTDILFRYLIKPCETVNATDTRYLNQTHAPIINLLKKQLHVELYN